MENLHPELQAILGGGDIEKGLDEELRANVVDIYGTDQVLPTKPVPVEQRVWNAYQGLTKPVEEKISGPMREEFAASIKRPFNLIPDDTRARTAVPNAVADFASSVAFPNFSDPIDFLSTLFQPGAMVKAGGKAAVGALGPMIGYTADDVLKSLGRQFPGAVGAEFTGPAKAAARGLANTMSEVTHPQLMEGLDFGNRQLNFWDRSFGHQSLPGLEHKPTMFDANDQLVPVPRGDLIMPYPYKKGKIYYGSNFPTSLSELFKNMSYGDLSKFDPMSDFSRASKYELATSAQRLGHEHGHRFVDMSGGNELTDKLYNVPQEITERGYPFIDPDSKYGKELFEQTAKEFKENLDWMFDNRIPIWSPLMEGGANRLMPAGFFTNVLNPARTKYHALGANVGNSLVGDVLSQISRGTPQRTMTSPLNFLQQPRLSELVSDQTLMHIIGAPNVGRYSAPGLKPLLDKAFPNPLTVEQARQPGISAIDEWWNSGLSPQEKKYQMFPYPEY